MQWVFKSALNKSCNGLDCFSKATSETAYFPIFLIKKFTRFKITSRFALLVCRAAEFTKIVVIKYQYGYNIVLYSVLG